MRSYDSLTRNEASWKMIFNELQDCALQTCIHTCTNVVNFKRPQSREGLLNKANTRPWYPSLLKLISKRLTYYGKLSHNHAFH